MLETTSTVGSLNGSSHTPTKKRIPASLMQMRRESLATAGKYKLPTMEVGKLPDNSLAGMAKASMGNKRATSGSDLPAFCTPMRTTPKTLKITLDHATSILTNPSLDLATGNNHSRTRAPIRRAKSVDEDTLGSKDMDSLLRTGLATPRRTGARRSVRLPANTNDTAPPSVVHKRISKLKSKQDPLACGSNHSKAEDSRKRGSAAGIRRARSVEEPPVRISRRDRRSASTKDRKKRDHDDEVSDISESTSASHSQHSVQWKCACGEEHDMECGFCGMCGATQRWACADCGYENKCKFKFCGMCGIVKKIKGDE